MPKECRPHGTRVDDEYVCSDPDCEAHPKDAEVWKIRLSNENEEPVKNFTCRTCISRHVGDGTWKLMYEDSEVLQKSILDEGGGFTDEDYEKLSALHEELGGG